MGGCGVSLIVSSHPGCVTVLTLIITAVCVVISALLATFPDFTDPQLGFETRGTEMSRRLTTYENLHRATAYNGPLEVNPDGDVNPRRITPRPATAANVASGADDIGHVALSPPVHVSQISGATDRLAETLKEEESADEDSEGDDEESGEDGHKHHHHVGTDGFFCEQISGAYSHLVVQPTAGISLLSAEALRAECALQANLMAVPEASAVCQKARPDQCCPPWSLANYVAVISNKTDCYNITEQDIADTQALLRNCEGVLTRRGNTSALCTQPDLAHALLYFISPSDPDQWPSTSLIFLPVARSAAVLPYYKALSPQLMKNDLVHIPAVDFGAAGALFDEYLLLGTVLMGFSFVFIVACMWLYTGSVCVTLGAVSAVIMALLIAHFIYTVVFGIKFFPFMNLLAVVIAIGIGADDAFIYVSAWRASEGVEAALRIAAPSMCVTSLTTAAALFANCVSPITAINCFSVFAGTAVLVNLALMLTWLPACVLIADSREACQWQQTASQALLQVSQFLTELVSAMEERLLWAVLALRWLWLLLLGGVAIASAVIVLHYPKLRLPDTTTVPLFDASHPFEQYDAHFRKMFHFEHDQKQDEGGRLLVQFVWGVLPEDNGNHLDPASRGQLVYDPEFDVTSQESQKWLLQFCREIRQQPWYQPQMGPQLGACFIESFKGWMGRRCKAVGGESRAPCCETSPFPFSHRVFTRCITKAIAHLHATPQMLYQRSLAGPKFARGKREIRALVIEFESNYTFSTSLPEMTGFYTQVETWFQMQLSAAPVGMRGGWFVSDLGFWDLQSALNEGTQSAILVSLGVALVVVFLSTLNSFISLFTVFTIASIIFVTVAIMVLLGWRLNVLESVAVTTAIGLAVDLPLHYAVHYGQGVREHRTRHDAVAHAVTRMAGPTAMAALTTAAAGGFMLLSSVLPYIQVGLLLLILTFISWLFATFLLMPILAIAGPVEGCGQLRRPRPSRWCHGPPEDKPQPVLPPASDVTISTSSGPAEFHELQALRACQSPV